MRVALALALMLAAPAAAQDGLGGQLPYAPPPPADVADPIAVAFAGLNPVEVEDDLNPGDARIDKAVTANCVTTLSGPERSWTIDWRTIEVVAPADTFVFVKGKDVSLAVIGDASRPDQATKLGALYAAMAAIKQRCG